MLAAACTFAVTVSFILELLACIGVSPADKAENFKGISTKSSQEGVKIKDMITILKTNRALQTYIFAATSDKLAMQTAGQAVVTTMLYGIIIGNMQLSTIVTMVAMLPSIIFAIYGGRYAGKHGNKESIITWTRLCIITTAILIVFFGVTSSWTVGKVMPLMIVFFVLTLSTNGCKMCVTTATGAMLADIIDYELDRSGKYMPGTMTGVYSFVDKLVSSLGAMIATGSVAVIGYTAVMPQPTDERTPAIFIMTLILNYGLPILGWICTLVALKFSPLSKEKMVEVQQNIQEKKAQAEAE